MNVIFFPLIDFAAISHRKIGHQTPSGSYHVGHVKSRFGLFGYSVSVRGR
jgi:hypothetical protein